MSNINLIEGRYSAGSGSYSKLSKYQEVSSKWGLHVACSSWVVVAGYTLVDSVRLQAKRVTETGLLQCA